MLKLSIMQGRVINSESKKIQSFPYKNWMSEFEKLKLLKIKKLQWIYENNKLNDNPLNHKNFKKLSEQIKKKFNVRINSICADEFINRPLIRSQGLNKKSLKVLLKLISLAQKLNIDYIILPFIDNSSIKKLDYVSELKNLFEIIYPKLIQSKIEIHLETDIPNKKIAKIINSEDFQKYIKINFDSGNTVSLGYNLYREIMDAELCIGSIHIKDRTIGGITVPLGYGDVNFHTLFGTLKKINYNGEYVLQAARIEGLNNTKLIGKYLDFLKQFK